VIIWHDFLFDSMELIRACKCGDIATCKEFIEANPNFTNAFFGEMSPLHWLLMGSSNDDVCVSIIDLIKQFGVNQVANDVSTSGTSFIEKLSNVTALHVAIWYKGLDVVRKLLSAGANPDLQDSNGYSALAYACKQNSLPVVQLLIEYGANPAILTRTGESIYSLATCEDIRKLLLSKLNFMLLRCIRKGSDIETIQNLIEAKADINATDPDGTPCFILVLRSGDYQSLIKMLETDSLDPNLTDTNTGNNALHELSASGLAESQKIEIGHELLFRGIDLSHRNKANESPVDRCMADRSMGLVRLLIDNGARTSNYSSLTEVSAPNEAESLRVGVNSAPTTAEPSSPSLQMDQASSVREDTHVIDLTETAVRLGALFFELQGARQSASSMSKESTSAAPEPKNVENKLTEQQLVEQKMELLKKLNMYLSEFERIKGNKNKDFKTIGTFIELQKMISDSRKEINKINDRITSGDFLVGEAPVVDDSGSPKLPSSWFRSPDSIEADIEGCIRSIRKSTGSSTGVSSAVYELLKRSQSTEAIPVLKLLRNRGSDINFRDKETGKTALMIVCGSSHPGIEELVEWMVANSADVCLVDKSNGWTALHYAVASGNKRLVECIIGRGKGGLINVRDSQGRTAIDICNNPAIRKVLQPTESTS
jgi:ankyrin repeat protein